MFRGGNPYTDFHNINCKEGRFRIEAQPFGTKFQVAPTTISADRTIWVCDGSGSLMVKGYHFIYGTAWVGGTLSLVPVGVPYYANNLAVTGIKVTSIVQACVHSTATAAGLMVVNARCRTDGYLSVGLAAIGSTVANASLQIAYLIMNPQTT